MQNINSFNVDSTNICHVFLYICVYIVCLQVGNYVSHLKIFECKKLLQSKIILKHFDKMMVHVEFAHKRAERNDRKYVVPVK